MSRVTFAIPARWLALFVCMPAWAAHYSVIEIPAPLTNAVALNDNGDIVGHTNIYTPGLTGALLYQRSSGLVSELPCVAPLPCSAQVTGINDDLTAVGSHSNSSDGPQAVRWPLNAAAEYVNQVVNTFSDANGIANNGDVIGNLLDARGPYSFLWKADGSGIGLGSLVDCGICDFFRNSAAAAINDSGHIVGWAEWVVSTTPSPDGPFLTGVHAFLWRDGEMADLGALDGGDGSYSSANALNNEDEIVGVTSVGSVNTAFRYARGRMRNLGNLGHQPDLNSDAAGINDRGEIVGSSDVRLANDAVVQRAFLYSSGHMWNLNSLLDRRSALSGHVKLTNAVAINCKGWIAANGYDVRTGEAHAYLLKRRGAERRECRHPRQ